MALNAVQISLARGYLDDPGSSAVQSVLIQNATGGTFTITYAGQTTSALVYNAGANVIQNALCDLSTIGIGNLTVNNVAPYVLYFTGELGSTALPMVTVDDSDLDGTGVLVAVAQVTAGGVFVFSDAELDAHYAEASQNFWLMICYSLQELLVPGAKQNDYTAGQTQEKRSQIFDHLKYLVELYYQRAIASQQVLIASLVPEPPKVIAVPWTVGFPAQSLTYAPPYGPRGRGRGGW